MDGCRCSIFANRQFAQYVTNVKVEVVEYEQNGQRSFKVAMIVENVSNAIEYVEWWTSR